MESVLQTLLGFLFVLTLLTIVFSRLLTGRVFPKREIILPNQRGVLVSNDQIVRVAGPGVCWVRPRQRLVLVDARPKPLQMSGVEVLGSDHAVVRLSLSAEYKVSDAAIYYSSSANTSDAFFVQVRRAVNVAARQLPGSALAASPEQFSSRIIKDLVEPATKLGLEIVHLDVYEAVPRGFLRASEESSFEFPDSGLVH